METPLHLACLASNSMAVAILLEYGGDPTKTTVLGDSPLHYAVFVHSFSAVKVLLNASSTVCTVDLKNSRGLSPVTVATQSQQQQVATVLKQRSTTSSPSALAASTTSSKAVFPALVCQAEKGGSAWRR